MVCILSILQAPVQALLRPAMWIPGLNKLHSHKETWSVDVSPEDCVVSLLSALEKVAHEDTTGSNYDVHMVDPETSFVRIFAFTWAEWLDVVEITFTPGEAKAVSFSSGFLPMWIPFACVFNCVFFWVPFLDKNLNKERLNQLRLAMDICPSLESPS